MVYRWLRHYVGAYGAPRAAASHGVYHRDMAYALDALGREDEAAAHYARFAEAWQNADPNGRARSRRPWNASVC